MFEPRYSLLLPWLTVLQCTFRRLRIKISTKSNYFFRDIFSYKNAFKGNLVSTWNKQNLVSQCLRVAAAMVIILINVKPAYHSSSLLWNLIKSTYEVLPGRYIYRYGGFTLYSEPKLSRTMIYCFRASTNLIICRYYIVSLIIIIGLSDVNDCIRCADTYIYTYVIRCSIKKKFFKLKSSCLLDVFGSSRIAAKHIHYYSRPSDR